VRYAEGRSERFSKLAAELVRIGVDVLVTSSQPGALTLKHATGSIPIVLFGVSDPVGAGLVQSLARPGGNVTGVAWEATPEEMGKRLQLLKEAVPSVSGMAVLWRRQGATDDRYESALRAAAEALGVKLRIRRVQGSEDLEGAFAASRKEGAGAVIVWLWGGMPADRRRAAEIAARYRLPAMYGVRDYVDAGGLMSYGPNIADMQRRAVTFVDRILKGAKPADLPVEQPTRYELVINLKAAKALSLTIPPSLLARGGPGHRVMRRRFIIVVAMGVLASPLAAEAQQVGKVFRLGYLLTGTAAGSRAPHFPSLNDPSATAFRDGMRELGYVYGEHFIVETRSAQGRLERLQGFATELVDLKVDLIVVSSTPQALAAKNATSTVHIVMTTPGDPVGDGLVASLAGPRGN
jgi:putative ABC transport system substrate-binding protein